MVQGLNGIPIPTFSGDVTETSLDPGVAPTSLDLGIAPTSPDFGIAPTLFALGVVPTFDAAFVVKVTTGNPSVTASLVTEAQSETPTFDRQAIIQVV